MALSVTQRTVRVTLVATLAALAISVVSRAALDENLTWINVLVVVVGTVVIAGPIAYYMAAQAHSLAQAYQMLTAANADLRFISEHDDLTGLLNRRALMELLDQKAPRDPWSVLMLDVDHFKTINDQFGHPVGDEALKLVSKTLQAHLSEGSIAARIGGEEFAVVLGSDDPERISWEADRIRTHIEELALIVGGRKTVHMTVSIGCVRASGLTPSQAFTRADKALYQAKAAGRNQVMLYSEGKPAEKKPPLPVAQSR